MKLNLSKYKLTSGLLTLIAILSFTLITINSISATTNPATIDNITPNQGPTTGNQTVVINGDGFKTKVVFDEISGGATHSCAIASDGKAYCWGQNNVGQLGDNSTTNSPVPVAVDTSGVLSSKTIKQISAGAYHTCAIASDNQAYCWGSGSNGKLGNGSTANSPVPVAILTKKGSLITSVAFGDQIVTDFDSLTNAQITLKTPAHPIGTVDLTLTDDLGRITTLAEGYTYIEDTPPPSDDDTPPPSDDDTPPLPSDDGTPPTPSDEDTSLLPPNAGLTNKTKQSKLALITALATIITLVSGLALKLKKNNN